MGVSSQPRALLCAMQTEGMVHEESPRGGPGAREWAQCLADAHLICCWARGQQSEKTCGAPVGKKQFPELGLGQAAAVLHLHEFKGWGRLKARPEPDTSFLEAQPPGDFMPRPGPRLEAIFSPPTSATSSPPPLSPASAVLLGYPPPN